MSLKDNLKNTLNKINPVKLIKKIYYTIQFDINYYIIFIGEVLRRKEKNNYRLLKRILILFIALFLITFISLVQKLFEGLDFYNLILGVIDYILLIILLSYHLYIDYKNEILDELNKIEEKLNEIK